jgi:DNA-binding FadR family transcriptional regulator
MEICKILHIGRSTLREALKSLAFVGLVQMRHGGGTFVAQGRIARWTAFWPKV